MEAKRVIRTVFPTLGGILFVVVASTAGVAQTMTRLTVDRIWHPGNDKSSVNLGNTTMPMSSDGRYVVFDSLASNLVAGDTNGCADVFVQERATGKLVRMSVSSAGVQGNGWSVDPAISSTGRFVAFVSAASNLVAGDTNGSEDVFLHDRDPDGNGIFDEGPGVTTRISVDSYGHQTTGHCLMPTISSDGNRILFCSDATNLVPGDTNNRNDAFLRDVAAGTTTRVDLTWSTKGPQANQGCVVADLSADGNFVAFSSDSTNLVSGDANGVRDVFVRDLRYGGTTTRVSVDSAGNQGNGASSIGPHCLSSDGNVVAFSSNASNLVPGDSNGACDVFVRYRATGATVLASLGQYGNLGNGESSGATINAAGTRVAFSTIANNLVWTDPNGTWDVLIRDLSGNYTDVASYDPWWVPGNGKSYGATIDASGQFVMFGSEASDLVSYDANASRRDVFIRDSYYSTTSFVSANPPRGQSNGTSKATAISANNRYVAFESSATNLVELDTNGRQDVFVADRQTGAIARVSVNSAQQEGNSDSNTAVLSSDGRFVAFDLSPVNHSTRYESLSAPNGARRDSCRRGRSTLRSR